MADIIALCVGSLHRHSGCSSDDTLADQQPASSLYPCLLVKVGRVPGSSSLRVTVTDSSKSVLCSEITGPSI